MEVIWAHSVPSVLHTHTSIAPDRADSNATRLPSGEKLGVLSVRVEESGLLLNSPRSHAHRSVCPVLRVYASRSPLRDSAGAPTP